MGQVLIKAENLGKKFCRNLKRSLWYGTIDLFSEIIGINKAHNILRKNEFWAIRHISFTLNSGDTLGLVGRNGAGKTTLLRMLNGLIKPDEGRVEIIGRMQALIALGAGFNPILTGRENIYVNASVLGIPKKETDRQLDEIVDFSGIEEFIDTPVQNYSSGMAVRLGFAVAAHMEPDILLVDEVLAVGDVGFQSKCLKKIGELKENGTAIILVSHNMHTISTFANRVMLLNKGSQVDFTNVSEGVGAYRKLFFEKEEMDIEKVCSGDETIDFSRTTVSSQQLKPGDAFTLSIIYESSEEYGDIEVDIGIYSSNEPFLHFQATNKAYQRNINLYKGRHGLDITIDSIRINDAMGTITFAIWSKNRIKLLFWWRIPVQFAGIPFSTGNSFLNVIYKKNDIGKK